MLIMATHKLIAIRSQVSKPVCTGVLIVDDGHPEVLP